MDYMNGTIRDILNRKSVRQYSDKDVEKEKVSLLLKAAMSAPSAVELRPWEFIVIDNRKLLDELGEYLPYTKMIFDSKLAVVICGNFKRASEESNGVFWIQDCCAATENLLIAAESLGLGAVWTAIYPDEERIKFLQKKLELPEDVIPLNVIPIGYPFKKVEADERWDANNVHSNKW